MSQECNHDCSSCGEDCAQRKESLIEQPHEMSQYKKGNRRSKR